jgi:PAS domain S-box-containing protein
MEGGPEDLRPQLEREQRQRRTYEVALDSIPDLVYVFDLEHRFIYANAPLLAVWGKSREEAHGKTCLELGYPEWEARLHDREIDQVVATRKPVHGEVTFDGATGRRVWEYVFSPVLGPDGAVVAVAGTGHDATVRREYDEALAEHALRLQQADRAKDEFIATLSQELRNPLTPLRSAVSLLLRDDKVDERTLRIHRTMARQVDQLARLVDDLFEIACISRGDLVLRREPVQLAIVIRNALESVEPILHARRHRLSVQMPAERVWVDADAQRLAQVVANLVDNAARYTADGGQVDVLLEPAEGSAVVRVRDNGPGITPQSRQRIFELFERGDQAQREGEGGLGVGLALARRLAHLHGARLEASSEGPGRGSEFRLSIPTIQDPTLRVDLPRAAERPVLP